MSFFDFKSNHHRSDLEREMLDETTIRPSIADTEYLWAFDSTFQDLTSTFIGTPINGAGFSSSTITGYGSSLSLSSSLNQSVLINSTFLNLSGHSWTFEVWIYPLTVSSFDNSIVFQCETRTTDLCLHLVIRSGYILMGFYGDDLTGVTNLIASKWYHVAYVFDNNYLNQSIYLNGVFESSRRPAGTYQGMNGSLIIGTSTFGLTNVAFNGFIDQLYYINRAKTASEILDDATLTLYFSFDDGSIYDGGPLHINGSRIGSTSVVTGRVNQGLQIGPSAPSYFIASGLVLLGTSSQPYSMSIWIKPSSLNGTIIHVSRTIVSSDWCLEMLGLSSSGQLIASGWPGTKISIKGPVLSLNAWTHAAITYNPTNGLRLYVNGTLWNSTVAFAYVASGAANYLFLGNSSSPCYSGATAIGQYFGIVDEFRLYSRELKTVDVVTLANP